jgi:predicted ArsR family transcriptional regulator
VKYVSSRDLTNGDAGAVRRLGASRTHVLQVLQDAARALTVEDVAERVGRHTNTVRFHLDGLVEAGLAVRVREERDQPGRPHTLYAPTPDSPRAGRRSYQLLAEILTSYLAGQTRQPAQAAERAGAAWGRFLAERPRPFRRTDATAATSQLVRALDDIGFAPELVTRGRKRQVLLHHCPFREAAQEHREVVCSVHLGLMRGLLAELDAPVEAHRLEPFVEPSLCVAHLGNRPRRAEPTV